MGKHVLYPADDGLDWDRALTEFARYQYAGNLSAKTVHNREECLRMLSRRSGKLPLDVELTDLQEMLTRRHPRTGERLAQGTMQTERSYFQTFYTWLVEEGHLDRSPARRLRRIKVARRKARPFRMDQIDAILDSGAYSRTRDIIIIAALTGLRLGEVVRIRGEDFDGMMLNSVRKGSLEHRLAIAPVLAEIVDRYPKTGWWFPSPYPSEKFPNGGGHILMESASRSISNAIRRAGITDRRLTGHSLRHFFGTYLVRHGVSLRVVQELMGHASLATTQVYLDVDDEEMQEGVTVLPLIQLRERSGRRAKIAA